MFFHLDDRLVKASEVIGIFDMDNTTVSKITRDFLNRAEKKKELLTLSYELPKTFILCEKQGKVITYISEYSTNTLVKRAGFLKESSVL